MEYNITYREKDKGWQYIITVKENGKWKYKASKQGFRTRGLAKVAADKRLDELKEKSKVKLTEGHENITLAQFEDMFLSDLKLHREENTIINYSIVFKKFNELNEMKIEDIKFAHIQKSVNKMIENGLHPNTINQYVGKMKVLFKAAVSPYKVITENPITSDIMLPKIKKDRKVKALTKSELNNLLNKMYPEKDYVICLLASHCGMRVGEIIGLCETDIDLNKQEIDINKQWKRLKNGSYGFGTVKSQERVVPIPKAAIAPLRKYLSSNIKNIDGRVFSDRNTNTVCTRFYDKMKKIGFDNSIHDLRHTYATTLIANGVDFQTVAELMGDTVEVVIKTYSHFTDDMADTAARKVNQIF